MVCRSEVGGQTVEEGDEGLGGGGRDRDVLGEGFAVGGGDLVGGGILGCW